MTHRASSRSSAGTTLLEIVVAMTILGILIAAIFGAFIFASRVTATTSGRLVAMGYAQQTAENLRSAVGTTSMSAGAHPVTLPAGNPLASFNPTQQYLVRNGKFKTDGTIAWSPDAAGHVVNDEQGTPIDDTNYQLKEVTVQVQWTPPVKS